MNFLRPAELTLRTGRACYKSSRKTTLSTPLVLVSSNKTSARKSGEWYGGGIGAANTPGGRTFNSAGLESSHAHPPTLRKTRRVGGHDYLHSKIIRLSMTSFRNPGAAGAALQNSTFYPCQRDNPHKHWRSAARMQTTRALMPCQQGLIR